VLALTDDPDPRTAAMAWQWAAILAENEGAIEESGDYLDHALAMVNDDTTPWEVASINAQAATQALNVGDHARASKHALTAIPLLESLHSSDDAASMRAGLAISAVRQGRLDEAERLLDEVGEVPRADMTADLMTTEVRAELAILRGDVEGGLQAFDRCVETARGWGFFELSTDSFELWTLIALATDLAAHARFAETPERLARGAVLADQLLGLLLRFETVTDAAVDYPVTGMGFLALGHWLLVHEPSSDPETAIRLLAVADRFGYNRWFPVMGWEPLAQRADATAPGLLDAVLVEYGDRLGRELRSEAERVLASVVLTSSG
jgi:tetratricopeptide (TPR) repeat protein